MPRRCIVMTPPLEPPKKKTKVIPEKSHNLDVSICNDEALQPGIIFTDVQQKKWRIGNPIGRGSFGRIYLVSDDLNNDVTKQNARYVVKVEPHTNGTLFVEMHCLIRTAQISTVKEWRQRNNLRRLGMPTYVASGSYVNESTGIKYRFLVLPRYDIDLHKILSRTRVLDVKNVQILSLQILDVLEFLHTQGYTHSDIKSSNLMLGFDTKFFTKPLPAAPPSYQKETKTVCLSGKQRKAKKVKSKSSYYEDEDFVMDSKNSSDIEKRLANVKIKFTKFLCEKDKNRVFRHHAFNLRQLSNYVNYEDLSSSVCSDQSYQKLLDDFGSKNFMLQSEEKPEKNDAIKSNADERINEIYNEGIMSQSNGQIYLLDYGLASKFVDFEGRHKAFGMDARKAHDGTLEYSSRDSHIGAHSRRSDLETLGYNILDWLTGTLPWKTKETLEPDLVHALKKNFMSDIKSLLKTCFKSEFYPKFLEKYFEYVTSLDFTEAPDYEYCRSLFKSELLKSGFNCNKELSLNFDHQLVTSTFNRKLLQNTRIPIRGSKSSAGLMARNGIKKSYERENICSFESGLRLELLRQTLNSSSDGIRKPCTSRNFFVSDADLVARLKKSLMPHGVLGKKLSPKNLRSNKKKIQKRRKRAHRNSIGKFGNFLGSARQYTWAEILAGNPEDFLRKDRTVIEDDDTCKYMIRKLSNASKESDEHNTQSPLKQKDYLQGSNPTYAMKEVVANFKKKSAVKTVKLSEELKGYTPVMIKYHRIKKKREEKEKQDALKEKREAAKESLVKKQTREKSVRTLRNKCANIEPVCRRTRSRRTIENETEVDKKKINNDTKSKRRSVNKSKSPTKVVKKTTVNVRLSKSKNNKTFDSSANRRVLRSGKKS